MKFLKQWRRRNEMTQAELAQKLGVSQVAISKWEAGILIPSPLMVGQLATILDIPLAMLNDYMNMLRWSRLLEKEDLDQGPSRKERR